MATLSDFKKALVAAGFEVYRTRGDRVHLADRVRENLLMDSGVFVDASRSTVGFIVRAQRSDFPSEADDRLFERARSLADAASSRGYAESLHEVRAVADPGDPARTIDTWCEIGFERQVSSVDAAIDEVRFVMSLEKAASR